MNSAYGAPTRQNYTGTIMLYHPLSTQIYDRVFIFAHELGHALHFALTKDINIFPDGFDKLNELFGMKNLSVQEKQEAFADATAYTILSGKLKAHLPEEFHQAFLPWFTRYFGEITNRYRF